MNFFKRFQAFVKETTFVEVAIGLLIASAAKDLITSFTDSFLTPIITRLFSLLGLPEDPTAVIDVFGIKFTLYAFITDFIAFILILFVAFMILESYNKLLIRLRKEEEPKEEVVSKEALLLEDIKKLLEEKNNK